MISAVVILGVLAVTLIGLLALQLSLASTERARWALERSELLSRIQHPEVIWRPQNAPQQLHVVPEDEEQLNLVGQIIGD